MYSDSCWELYLIRDGQSTSLKKASKFYFWEKIRLNNISDLRRCIRGEFLKYLLYIFMCNLSLRLKKNKFKKVCLNKPMLGYPTLPKIWNIFWWAYYFFFLLNNVSIETRYIIAVTVSLRIDIFWYILFSSFLSLNQYYKEQISRRSFSQCHYCAKGNVKKEKEKNSKIFFNNLTK